MRKFLVSTCMVLSSAASAYAAESVITVFGLPLGGKVPQFKECTVDEIVARKNKAHCWVGKPFTGKDGGRLGNLKMADSDVLPEWAASAKFKAQISRQAHLELLTLEGVDGQLKHTIANSLSKRFGLPVQTTLPQTDWAEAKWIGEGIEVFQRCTVKSCEVRFLSPAAVRQMVDTEAETKRVNSARPATP